MAFDRALQIGICGEPKGGKSYLASCFARDLGGVVLDIAYVYQYKKSTASAPTYSKSPLTRGDAYPACLASGLDIDNQYRYVRDLSELEESIEYARFYRDDISEKPNGRVWLVFDDTYNWRQHEAFSQSLINKHKSMVKDDWAQATGTMKNRILGLSAEFNLLFVNRVITNEDGVTIGQYLPNGIISDYTLYGELYINREVKPYNQRFRVDGNRIWWLCSDDYLDDIPNPTPKKILEGSRVDPSLW